MVVANPADPANVTAASQCTPGVTNDTVWVLNASLQGQTINIPVFVRKVGPYVTQTVCFSPPQTAAFGAQLVLADFTVKGIFTNATKRDGYEWAGIFTPYLATGAPNPRHRRVAHLGRLAAVADLQAREDSSAIVNSRA